MPPSRTATTEGPDADGSQTRPTSVPAVPSSGSIDAAFREIIASPTVLLSPGVITFVDRESREARAVRGGSSCYFGIMPVSDRIPHSPALAALAQTASKVLRIR